MSNTKSILSNFDNDYFKMVKPVFKFALREDLKDYKNFLPTRGEPQATGWDVRAAMRDKKSLTIFSGEYVKIPLGIRGFCPPGWWYELKPRSSSFAKKGLHALYGTIDETFENELIFAAQFLPPMRESDGKIEFYQSKIVIDFGEAIGQIVPVKRQEMEVEEISNEDYEKLCLQRNGVRGKGGFGSTG